MRQNVALIAALSSINNVIGLGGQLPWGKPFAKDMQRFRDLTEGQPVVMSRQTYESIPHPPDGDRLDGRAVLLLTRCGDAYEAMYPDNVMIVHSVEEAISISTNFGQRLWVAGGAQVYGAFMPHATHMYLTEVDEAYEGDTHFPAFMRDYEWDLKYENIITDDPRAKYRFCDYWHTWKTR